jgi:hypothetical protein
MKEISIFNRTDDLTQVTRILTSWGGFCELTHPTYDRLTRANAMLLLVDHQVSLVAGSRYPEPQDLRKNVVGLARASKILDVPIVRCQTECLDPSFPS